MNPAQKRFDRDFLPLANAISRLEVTQTDREMIAERATDALRHLPNFRPELFRLLASDPLVLCAGTDVPCPDAIEIRTPMHLSTAPDGRSAVWQETRPVLRCLKCGSAALIGRPLR